MNFLLRAIAAVAAVSWFHTGAFAQNAPLDPCPRLEQVEDEENPVVRWLWSILPDDESAETPPPYGDSEYYFTIRAGRFVNISCNELEYEDQEMYPIGIVLRPVGTVHLEGFELATGSKPVLVITEYGHRKIVRESDIAPIEQDMTYIFADSAAKSMICRDGEDCPGNSEGICVDGKCRYDISARYGYAATESANQTMQRAVEGYHAVFPYTSGFEAGEGGNVDTETLQQSLAAACEPFPVHSFQPGAVESQPRYSYLTLCSKRAAYGADADGLAPFKIVDAEYAKRAFHWTLDGSFHRRFGGSSSATEQVLAALGNYRITASKECGVEMTTENALEFAGGINAKFNAAGVLQISAGADRSLTTTITQTISGDDYLLMSTYFMEPISNAPEVEGVDPDDMWIFRVIFRSHCENGTPLEPTSIIIHYNRLSGGLLEVNASNDLRQSYVADWSTSAYAPAVGASFLREGQFWEIKGLIGYYAWRDTLRKFIERDNPVTSNLLSRYPKEQRAFVRDFFSFLMLAAAYHHRDPRL